MNGFFVNDSKHDVNATIDRSLANIPIELAHPLDKNIDSIDAGRMSEGGSHNYSFCYYCDSNIGRGWL